MCHTTNAFAGIWPVQVCEESVIQQKKLPIWKTYFVLGVVVATMLMLRVSHEVFCLPRAQATVKLTVVLKKGATQQPRICVQDHSRIHFLHDGI